MAHESDGREAGAGRVSAGRVAAEVAVVAILFAAAGAWPVPDLNETVYLTKARHAADPAWGAGDFFLETPDAHGVFYLLAGPLTAALPLDRAAWIGRILGWLAVAAGFRHAVVPLLREAPARIAAAALFSLALRFTTAAGEWVIGGCEAKVFAWALALAAIGELGRGRFPSAWCLLGGATAVHPIVGGWGMVALVGVWCLTHWLCVGERPGGRVRAANGLLGRLTGPGLLAGGVALAAAGIVPALGLSANVAAAERAAAVRTYVVERLYHHLLPFTFPEAMVARHVLAAVVWWLLAGMTAPTAARFRVHAFTAVSLLIALAGWGLAVAEPVAPQTVLGLLRFYWFRLADVMVPFSLAVSAAAVLADGSACARLVPGRPAVLRAAVVGVLAIDLAVQSRHWPLPGRVGLVSRADSKVNAAAWASVCEWVRTNTPPDARFLTPRGAASFTWRTDRAEVVSWKNSPQDARSLLEWKRRILDCFSRNGRAGTFVDLDRSTALLGVGRMREVADRYAADYAIVPADVPALDALPYERVHANDGYVVFRLTAPRPAARP